MSGMLYYVEQDTFSVKSGRCHFLCTAVLRAACASNFGDCLSRLSGSVRQGGRGTLLMGVLHLLSIPSLSQCRQAAPAADQGAYVPLCPGCWPRLHRLVINGPSLQAAQEHAGSLPMWQAPLHMSLLPFVCTGICSVACCTAAESACPLLTSGWAHLSNGSVASSYTALCRLPWSSSYRAGASLTSCTAMTGAQPQWPGQLWGFPVHSLVRALHPRWAVRMSTRAPTAHAQVPLLMPQGLA